MKNEQSGTIAAVCFTIIFVFVIFLSVYAVGYKNGQKAGTVQVQSPVYHLAQMPTERPVLAIYEGGGIVTMVTAFRMNDGRVLPHNVYGGPMPYDLLDEPSGWTAIPAGLLAVLK